MRAFQTELLPRTGCGRGSAGNRPESGTRARGGGSRGAALRRVSAIVVAAVLAAATLPAVGQPGYESAHGAPVEVWPGNDSVIDRIRRRGLLKVGVGLFEPWVICGANGGLIGYEVDVARRMADDMGVRIQFVRTDWYYIIPALLEEEFDLIISGMGMTPRRSLLVNFSIPYAEFGTAVVANTVRAGDRSTPTEFDREDILFGARAGTLPAQVVTDHFPRAGLRLFDADSALLDALLGGDVDAVVVDQVKAARWLDENPEVLHRPFAELFEKIPEAMALRKNDVDTLNFLDSWITHYRTSGWLAERRGYWFETRTWAEQAAADPEVAAACDASFEADPY